MSNRNSYDSHSNRSVSGMPLGPGSAPPPPVTPTGYTISPSAQQKQSSISKDRPRLSTEQEPSRGGPKLYAVQENSPSHCIEYVAIFASWILTMMFFPFAICVCFKVVREYERAVIFRMGRLREGGAKGPGTLFVLPCVDSCQVLDLRTVTFDVPPQEILTHDAVTVAVDAVVYYRVYNPTVAVANVEDYNRSTRLLASTTLRNVLGTKALSEILADRESIAHTMQSSLDEATDPWGVKVERVEIKDVRLPQQLQRTMAAEAEATREAKAKVIAAEGEMKASEALRNASIVLSQSPGALQLRYLQTLNTIAAEKNSTIVFPVPMEMLRAFVDTDC
jgi:erythrocyte band 7 integral membrane protein